MDDSVFVPLVFHSAMGALPTVFEFAFCVLLMANVFDISIKRCTTWSTARKHDRSAASLPRRAGAQTA